MKLTDLLSSSNIQYVLFHHLGSCRYTLNQPASGGTNHKNHFLETAFLMKFLKRGNYPAKFWLPSSTVKNPNTQTNAPCVSAEGVRPDDELAA